MNIDFQIGDRMCLFGPPPQFFFYGGFWGAKKFGERDADNANPLVMNDDCQAPLDVARAKGYVDVVRAIEDHICLFSGWMREFYGQEFFEMFVPPQVVSRKVWLCFACLLLYAIEALCLYSFYCSNSLNKKVYVLINAFACSWVVVLPIDSRNHTKPFKLGLAIYSSCQQSKDAKNGCRTTYSYCIVKANLEELNLNQPDPSVTIIDNASHCLKTWEAEARRKHDACFSTLQFASSRSGSFPETEIELPPRNETDMQQLHWFSDACKGIPQSLVIGSRVVLSTIVFLPPSYDNSIVVQLEIARIPEFLHNSQPPAAPATARPNAEDLELAMAINASIQSAILETSIVDLHSGNGVSASADWGSSSSTGEWTMIEASSGTISIEAIEIHNNDISAVPPTSIPSAPPATKEVVEDSPIQYRSIGSTPINAFLKLAGKTKHRSNIGQSVPLPSMPSSNCESLLYSAGKTKHDEGPLCTICMDAPSEAACGPCGHVAGCMRCLNEIKAKKWGCPVCRDEIQQVMKLYCV
ncbi:hypothetical protein CXB51_023709 [Gossypium anomalum]|uniref:RING-type domain-containing protein n=1 Tax=Gossypium anomalum TaxID=47600 RepID=A0A8J5YLL8_9ROSI|nr:hypothetical protein CXB51_023709 [Gossypium anomalum]